MSITSIDLNYISECARNTIGELRGKRMLELGNQCIKDKVKGPLPKKLEKNIIKLEVCCIRP